MRLSKEELTNKAKSIIGDSDEAISFLEDLADSVETVDVSAYETRISELETANADLTNKVAETDKAWREKYVSRFGEGSPAPSTEISDEIENGEEDIEIPSEEDIATNFM